MGLTNAVSTIELKQSIYGSPEAALLLAASSGEPSRRRIRELMAGPLDWPRLTRLAIESHATPGLWNVVSAFPNLPKESEALQTVAVLNDLRRYHIRSLVGSTIRDLRQAGVEVLVLKGAALLAGAIDNATPRTMSDIDMLVYQGSPEHAWRICQSKGWIIADPAATEGLYSEHHHLPPLVDSSGIGVGLELHRRLLSGVDRLGLDIPAFLSRSRTVTVGATEVRVPSREDVLLHACLHFAWSNKLSRGAWTTYADVHAIIADPSFSWERFLALATTTRRVRQCCYWTLRMGARVADLSVPEEVLARLDSSAGGPFGTLLERHFACRIANPDEASRVAERVQRWCWFAALRESSTSGEADVVWVQGDVEQPEQSGHVVMQRRGPVRALIGTVSYLSRLAFSAQ
jgi:hypothetical protein